MSRVSPLGLYDKNTIKSDELDLQSYLVKHHQWHFRSNNFYLQFSAAIINEYNFPSSRNSFHSIKVAALNEQQQKPSDEKKHWWNFVSPSASQVNDFRRKHKKQGVKKIRCPDRVCVLMVGPLPLSLNHSYQPTKIYIHAFFNYLNTVQLIDVNVTTEQQKIQAVILDMYVCVCIFLSGWVSVSSFVSEWVSFVSMFLYVLIESVGVCMSIH